MEGLTSQLPAPFVDTTLKQIKQIESLAKAIGTSSSGDVSDGDDMGEGEGDGDGDDDDGFDYYDYLLDDEDEDDDEDGVEEDDSLQKQFDNVDLPPGVEASVPWWKESDSTPASTDTVSSGVASQLCSSGSISVGQSSTGNGNGNGNANVNVKEESSDIIRKYQEFKNFDTVDDCSDHHFNNMDSQGQQPPKAWSKKIQSEWKILEKDLPDTIYVRVYETRMDLLRAVMVGPQGTPYHDGLFIFDVLFPSTYPDTPPVVYYYSGGLRLNPNLYDCGKVCLSLLNTWTGKGTEKWQPNTSTMLQVLVSIQGLILNENPFFNEPGYESSYVGAEGERRSKAYTENVFIMSLKTMMYTLKRPPRHFEDLVAGHFHIHAHDILSACKAYKEGAPVGFADRGKPPEGDNVPEHGRTRDFKAALTKITNVLVSTFTKYGVKDCEQFRITG
ncbi:PREDICTED: putative ubiquitin-conjugating enzyme E2 38 isoform X2 [Ipomoea nil]|uniref:putative ubiquitin-conjugating enzyme E2 38 isoform X2 n=1 Tax=Ipomoea nil TaxID=35883 RepID=UPI000901D292|nr:PREDICTED: putative ubiquitin-conjugating enzyme E2 38 isoform X2 [Ipomoea nil]